MDGSRGALCADPWLREGVCGGKGKGGGRSSETVPARWYFQLLLTRPWSLLEPRVGRSPPSCLHNRKITAAVSQGWRAMAVGAASCGLAPAPHGRSWGVAPATANRLMVRINLSSQEKMPFPFWVLFFYPGCSGTGLTDVPRAAAPAHCAMALLPGRVRSWGPSGAGLCGLPGPLAAPACTHGPHHPGMLEMARCVSRLSYNHLTDHALLAEVKSSLGL